ncbi:MAG: phasin family protein [Erythrobacter sp.]
MANNSNTATGAVSKIDAAAEKAYAEAAASTATASTEASPKAKAQKKAASKKAVAKKAPAKKKAAPKKTAAKRKPAKKIKKTKSKTKSAATPVTKLKDIIMAKAKDTNVTDTAKDMAADVQTRVKTAAAKATEFAGELNEFNKGNIEAVVESGKVFFAGAQEMGRENISTGKTVVETVTADVKKMAAVKSPTELVQLQGELARRNVDAAISFGSKNTENWLKIYNDAFAPISSRVSVAASRFKKAA